MQQTRYDLRGGKYSANTRAQPDQELPQRLTVLGHYHLEEIFEAFQEGTFTARFDSTHVPEANFNHQKS